MNLRHFVAFAALLASPALFASELFGVNLPETASVGEKRLTLNGLGARQATIFKVNVYIAGLYLEARSHDADGILGSTGVKKLEMRFVHDVPAKKLVAAWNESLEKNCSSGCEALNAPFAKLGSLMTDMKPGDTMIFVFHRDRVEVSVKDRALGSIEGAQFSRTLLATWLGGNPPNTELKSGLLGSSVN